MDTRVQDNDTEAAIHFGVAVASAIGTENAGGAHRKEQGCMESRTKFPPGAMQAVAVVPADCWMRLVH